MAYSVEQFLAIIKPMVIEDMKKTKILASLTAAQALIESNKGNSGLTQKANNLFGMKGAYNGQSVTMSTKEFVNGGYITVNAKFRKYPNWADSIADHSGLFNRSARYTNLRGCTDYKQACRYVQQDGYASSPTYTTTLTQTIEKYRLYDWDHEALGQVIEQKTGNPYPEPTRNIKLNSRGNDVKWLQWMLNDKEHCGLIVDGIAGPKTISCLTEYQVHNNLKPDGICGPLTRASLKLSS